MTSNMVVPHAGSPRVAALSAHWNAVLWQHRLTSPEQVAALSAHVAFETDGLRVLQWEPSGSKNCGPPLGTCAGRYQPASAVAYALRWYKKANHDCNTPHDACTPYQYWGKDLCEYSSHGGDAANFVSQALVEACHAPLTGGLPCRGFCGRVEVGGKNLGDCLAETGLWQRKYEPLPPNEIAPGDVVIYHKR